MGVSDVGVPRRMKTFGGAYLGRAAAYGTALADARCRGRWQTALARNVVGGDEAAGCPRSPPMCADARPLWRTRASRLISRATFVFYRA